MQKTVVRKATLNDMKTLLRFEQGVIEAERPFDVIENAKPYLKHEKHAYLGFMYVVPECRGQGINRLIIEGLKTWSKAQKITELQLEVYEANKAAIKAYEKVGFSKLMVSMRIDLADG